MRRARSFEQWLIQCGLVCAVGLVASITAAAQDTLVASDARGGRSTEPVENATLPPLARVVTLVLDKVTVGKALNQVATAGGLQLSYSRESIPATKVVTLHLNRVTVRRALHEVLVGTGADFFVSDDGHVVVERQRRGPVVARSGQQDGTITGRVWDTFTRRPLPYATVLIEGLGRRTTTSDSGTYRLTNIPAGAYAMVVRILGYTAARKSVIVAEGQPAIADFGLQRSASELDQVVVTATGEERRAEVGNVIAKVNVDSLIPNAPVNSFNDILTARIPGVEVMEANGYTGMAADIRIRGLNSMTVSNNPIIIMDGVRIDNKPGDLALNGSQNEIANYNAIWANFGQLSGSLVNLNPDEIESLEVVKGPSATTLYGTDAANGVIVIKTKHGQVSKARMALYTEQGAIKSTGGIPDNYYAWGHSLSTGAPTQCLLANEAAGLCKIDSVTVWNPLENPATSPIKTGGRQVYGGQLSGGDAAMRYFGSAEYEDEIGYLRMPESEQARIAPLEGGAVPGYEIHPNVMQKGSLRGNLLANLGARDELTVSTGFLSNLVRIPASDNIFLSGETGLGYRDPTYNGWNPSYGQPGDIFAVRGDQHSDRFLGSVTNNWSPFGWLQTHATTGLDFTSTYLDGLQRYGEGSAFFGYPTGHRWNSRGTTTLTSVDLGVKATGTPLTDLKLTTAIGVQYNRADFGQSTAAGNGLIPGSVVGNGATAEYIGEVNQQNVVAGAYVEENVGWRERLFLAGALRADGSSAFGTNFRTALYPKVSASWVVSQEPLFRGATSWLSSLRLRAAYGASGVQPNPTDKLSLLTVTTALVDGTPQSAGILNTLANTHIKPERQAELEAGVDAEFWRGRLRIEGTYYNRQSTDALINLPLAASTGIYQQEINIGSVRNRGVEGSISSQVISWPIMTLDLTINGSINHNEILAIAPGVSNIPAVYSFYEQRVGYPIYGAWLQPVLGYHANSQGLIGPNDITIGDTATYQGSTVPTRQFAFSGALAFLHGHARLSSLFDYRGGYRFLDLGEALYRGLIYGDSRAVNDPSAPLALQAQAQQASQTGSYVFSYDGTYMRWRELALTLEAPQGWAQALRAQTASITLSGRNLGLWTKVPGLQPERSYLDNAAFPDQRYAVANAPMSRYWLARVNLGF